ncbi:hypothetical protein E2C01_072147 [Portunus trituberculatus]|uniref:Uncharacterized protein n=1 Tax=Portunus trituberculatus TaxID=210409 RepID=A0A5B7I700_PORTR|nr:hypothetical protein [Portunus trituberculatus]
MWEQSAVIIVFAVSNMATLQNTPMLLCSYISMSTLAQSQARHWWRGCSAWCLGLYGSDGRGGGAARGLVFSERQVRVDAQLFLTLLRELYIDEDF